MSDWKFATSEGVETPIGNLRYTLGASKKICAVFGGYVEAFSALGKFDPVAFETIAAAGLGKDRKDVEEQVFSTGYDTLLKPVQEYLAWLSNGGKAPTPVKPGTDSGNV